MSASYAGIRPHFTFPTDFIRKVFLFDKIKLFFGHSFPLLYMGYSCCCAKIVDGWEGSHCIIRKNKIRKTGAGYSATDSLRSVRSTIASTEIDSLRIN